MKEFAIGILLMCIVIISLCGIRISGHDGAVVKEVGGTRVVIYRDSIFELRPIVELEISND